MAENSNNQFHPGDRFSSAPVGKLVGFDVEVQPDNSVAIAMEVRPEHMNPMGFLHGGIMSTIADAAMGITFGRSLDSEQNFTTIELKVNFIRGVTQGKLVAKGRIVKRGTTIGFLDCEVHDQLGRLVATATSTCIILPQHLSKS